MYRCHHSHKFIIPQPMTLLLLNLSTFDDTNQCCYNDMTDKSFWPLRRDTHKILRLVYVIMMVTAKMLQCLKTMFQKGQVVGCSLLHFLVGFDTPLSTQDWWTWSIYHSRMTYSSQSAVTSQSMQWNPTSSVWFIYVAMHWSGDMTTILSIVQGIVFSVLPWMITSCSYMKC